MTTMAKRFPKGQRVSLPIDLWRGTVVGRKLISGLWWIMVIFDGTTRSCSCDPARLRRLRRKGAIGRMVEDVVKLDPSPEYVVSDYYSDSEGHRAYRFMLRHPATDVPVGQTDALVTAMVIADVKDGDEVRIVVVKTGRRPFGDRRVVLRAPHTYVRETEAQKKERVATPPDPDACSCCAERKGMS